MWFAIRPMQKLLISPYVTPGTVTASKAVVVGANKDVDHLEFLAGTGAASAGVLHGGGTAVNPNTSALAANFMSYYNQSTAATGTARGLYNRLFLSGGAGGEAVRAYTTVSNNAPADTVNGAHISLDFGAAAGNVTGLGTASRNTLHVPNRALNGTTSVVMSELWADGASSTSGGQMSLFSASVGGNATGKALIESTAYFLNMTLTGGSDKIYHDSASLKCLMNGSPVYIPVLPAESDAVVLGVGSEAAYYDFGATINKNAMVYRFTTAAASGTSRGLYLRMKATGGAGGEALRSYMTVENDTPADTVNGAHISLDFGAAAGNVTGLGTASRHTLHVPDRQLTGTTGAILAELWADGSNSDINGQCALIRAEIGGDGAGAAAISLASNFWDLTCTDTAGGMVQNQSSWAVSKSLKVRVNGVTYYVPLSTVV
jgi:hypothetical protein